MGWVILGKLLKLGQQDNLVKPQKNPGKYSHESVHLTNPSLTDVCIRGGLLDYVVLGILGFFFWLHPWHVEVPGPQIESEPLQ